MFPNFLFQFSPFEEQQSPPEPEQSNGLSSGPSNSTQLILFRSPTPQLQPRPQVINNPTINSNRAPLLFVTRRQQPAGNSFFLPFASRQPAIPLETLLQFLQGGGNPPPPPADRAFVASLPVRRIAESDERKDCVVCQSQFEVDEECMELPCAHTFHPDCVRPWLSEHNTCPTCRHQLPAEPRREAADQSHVEQPQGEPQVAQLAQHVENAPAEPVPRVDPVQETAITPANREVTPAMMQSILRHRIALAEAALALDQEEIARAQAIIQHAEARMAFTRAFAESSRAQLAELMPPQSQPQPAIAMQPALQNAQPQQPQASQLQSSISQPQPQAAPSQTASIQPASQPPSTQAERTESDEVKSDRQSMETMQNELSALQTQVRKQERRIRALESALTAAKKVASRAAAQAAPEDSSSRMTTEEQMRNNLRAHFSGKPVRRRPASNLTVDTSVVASAGQTQDMEIDAGEAPDSDGRKKRKLEAGNETS